MSANEKSHRTPNQPQPSVSMDYANIAVSVKSIYFVELK